jgi:hypothetical protein
MCSESSQLLVQHLYLEAGRFMENASVHLAHALPTDPIDRAAHLQQMLKAAADVHSPMNAAEALSRRASEI